jgi:hypothetical protein
MNTKHKARRDENKTCTHFGNWPSPPPLPSIAAALAQPPTAATAATSSINSSLSKNSLEATITQDNALLPQQQQRYKTMAGILLIFEREERQEERERERERGEERSGEEQREAMRNPWFGSELLPVFSGRYPEGGVELIQPTKLWGNSRETTTRPHV